MVVCALWRGVAPQHRKHTATSQDRDHPRRPDGRKRYGRFGCTDIDRGRGDDNEGSNIRKKARWLTHRGAPCAQRLLGTRIGEASHLGPRVKSKTEKSIANIFSPKRSHSHLHTPTTLHLLLVPFQVLLSFLVCFASVWPSFVRPALSLPARPAMEKWSGVGPRNRNTCGDALDLCKAKSDQWLAPQLTPQLTCLLPSHLFHDETVLSQMLPTLQQSCIRVFQ